MTKVRVLAKVRLPFFDAAEISAYSIEQSLGKIVHLWSFVPRTKVPLHEIALQFSPLAICGRQSRQLGVLEPRLIR